MTSRAFVIPCILFPIFPLLSPPSSFSPCPSLLSPNSPPHSLPLPCSRPASNFPATSCSHGFTTIEHTWYLMMGGGKGRQRLGLDVNSIHICVSNVSLQSLSPIRIFSSFELTELCYFRNNKKNKRSQEWKALSDLTVMLDFTYGLHRYDWTDGVYPMRATGGGITTFPPPWICHCFQSSSPLTDITQSPICQNSAGDLKS